MTGALEEMNVIPETERSSQAQAEVGRTRSVSSDSSEDVPLQVRCKKRALSMHKTQPPSSTKKIGYKKSGLKRSREDAEQEESSPEFPSPLDNVSTSHGVGSSPARARQGLPDFKRMSISSSVEDKLAIYRHKVAKLIREGQVTHHSLLLTLNSQRIYSQVIKVGAFKGEFNWFDAVELVFWLVQEAESSIRPNQYVWNRVVGCQCSVSDWLLHTSYIYTAVKWPQWLHKSPYRHDLTTSYCNCLKKHMSCWVFDECDFARHITTSCSDFHNPSLSCPAYPLFISCQGLAALSGGPESWKNCEWQIVWWKNCL